VPSLKKFFEAVDYKINGGFKFGWSCYGQKAFSLDAGNFSGWGDDDNGYWSAGVVYDLETQQVLEISYYNQYERGDCGRWIHPRYVQKSKREAKKRGVPFAQAFDDVDFKELGERAILNRISAIVKKAKRKKGKKKAA
jgi:hypothetical protein